MAQPTQVDVAHEWAADQWDWPLQRRDGVVKVINDPQRFEVGLEMNYFTPKEVDVKILGHDLVVHCQHDERTDHHGTISRTLDRVYKLASDVDLASLKAVLKADGILHIYANKLKHPAAAGGPHGPAQNVPVTTQ